MAQQQFGCSDAGRAVAEIEASARRLVKVILVHGEAPLSAELDLVVALDPGEAVSELPSLDRSLNPLLIARSEIRQTIDGDAGERFGVDTRDPKRAVLPRKSSGRAVDV